MSDYKEHGHNTLWTEPYWDEGIPQRCLNGKRTKRFATRVRHEKVIMSRNRRRAAKKIIDASIIQG